MEKNQTDDNSVQPATNNSLNKTYKKYCPEQNVTFHTIQLSTYLCIKLVYDTTCQDKSFFFLPVSHSSGANSDAHSMSTEGVKQPELQADNSLQIMLGLRVLRTVPSTPLTYLHGSYKENCIFLYNFRARVATIRRTSPEYRQPAGYCGCAQRRLEAH